MATIRDEMSRQLAEKKQRLKDAAVQRELRKQESMKRHLEVQQSIDQAQALYGHKGVSTDTATEYSDTTSVDQSGEQSDRMSAPSPKSDHMMPPPPKSDRKPPPQQAELPSPVTDIPPTAPAEPPPPTPPAHIPSARPEPASQRSLKDDPSHASLNLACAPDVEEFMLVQDDHEPEPGFAAVPPATETQLGSLEPELGAAENKPASPKEIASSRSSASSADECEDSASDFHAQNIVAAPPPLEQISHSGSEAPASATTSSSSLCSALESGSKAAKKLEKIHAEIEAQVNKHREKLTGYFPPGELSKMLLEERKLLEKKAASKIQKLEKVVRKEQRDMELIGQFFKHPADVNRIVECKENAKPSQKKQNSSKADLVPNNNGLKNELLSYFPPDEVDRIIARADDKLVKKHQKVIKKDKKREEDEAKIRAFFPADFERVCG